MAEDAIFGISGGEEEIGALLNKEVLDTLFSKDEEKLLMITDLDSDDLVWATGFQAMLRFMVDDFIRPFDRRLANKCYKFMQDVYKMRISKKRLGRTELFDAIKSQTTLEMAQNEGMFGGLRRRVGGV